MKNASQPNCPILITGGNGLVGKPLTQALLDEGFCLLFDFYDPRRTVIRLTLYCSAAWSIRTADAGKRTRQNGGHHLAHDRFRLVHA